MAQQPMKKADLVSAIANRASVTQRDADAVLNALSDVILEKVPAGEAITLQGIGKISSRDRAARKVRNPRTGDVIEKAADRTPRMTFSKTLKDACN